MRKTELFKFMWQNEMQFVEAARYWLLSRKMHPMAGLNCDICVRNEIPRLFRGRLVMNRLANTLVHNSDLRSVLITVKWDYQYMLQAGIQPTTPLLVSYQLHLMYILPLTMQGREEQKEDSTRLKQEVILICTLDFFPSFAWCSF
jgi:hypothetical protein